jgi:tetratricopeptide (TPR) repeat protein
LRKEAEYHLSLGSYQTALDVLGKALEVDDAAERQLDERRKARNLSRAATLSARAGVKRTLLAYLEAAADFAAAADLVEKWDKQLALDYALGQGDNLYDQGDEFGDNHALVDAIAAYQRSLALAPRETHSWARAKINLGNALRVLGERESGTKRLEEAVAAYREVLLEHARERVRVTLIAYQFYDAAINRDGQAGGRLNCESR